MQKTTAALGHLLVAAGADEYTGFREILKRNESGDVGFLCGGTDAIDISVFS